MLEFLRAYRAWAFEGAKTHCFFDNDCGLCRNALEWDLANRNPGQPVEAAIMRRLYRDFPDNRHYPFGGEGVYYAAADAGNQHLNAERIKWVEKIIGELELFEFLSDWYLWALTADDATYSPSHGLCDNAPTDSVRALLRDYLRRDFNTSLNPFNKDMATFRDEHRNGTMQLNEKRLAWVNKMIGELKP